MRQADGDCSLVDKIQLWEVFTTFHNCLVCNKDSAVESWYEESKEFCACVLLLWSFKQVVEIMDHGLEQLTDKFVSKIWFQLVKEIKLIDKFFVIIEEWLIDVEFDFIV